MIYNDFEGRYLPPVDGTSLDEFKVDAKPAAIYDGGYKEHRGVCLRISNGGAGQVGLIGAWANAFIQYMVQSKGVEPFQVCKAFGSYHKVCLSFDTLGQGGMVFGRHNRKYLIPIIRRGRYCSHL